jgi:hypothetical protein
MSSRPNFRAFVWTLVPMWTLLLAGIWIHLQQISIYPTSLFQNSLVVSTWRNITTCRGFTPCWNTMCQLAGLSNVSWISLQIPTQNLRDCASGPLDLSQPSVDPNLFAIADLLAILSIFVELLNLATAAISLGFPFDCFNYVRCGLTGVSMVLMETAYILEIMIRVRFQSLISADVFEWSLIMDGMLMVIIVVSTVGSTLMRLSLSSPSVNEYRIL